MVHIIFWFYIVSLIMTVVSVFLSLLLSVKIKQKWYNSYTAVLICCGLILLSYICFFFIFKYSYKVTFWLNNLMIGTFMLICLVFVAAMVGLIENIAEKKLPGLQKGGLITLVIASLLSAFLYIIFQYKIMLYVLLFFILMCLLPLFFAVIRNWKKLYDSPQKKIVLYFIGLSVILFPVEIAEGHIHKGLIPADTYVPMGVLTFSLFCLVVNCINIIHCIRYFFSIIDQDRADYEDVPRGFIEAFSITGREKEIVEYLVKGYNHQDISGYLHISKRTVEKHSYNVYKKCRISSRVELLNLIRDYQ